MLHFAKMALAAACLAAFTVTANGQVPAKKIVFLAGPKEHGAPGRHEYERDLTELAWQLESELGSGSH